jgi:hypothetical protein
MWFLALTMGRAGTAGIGYACVTTRTIAGNQLRYRVALCISIAAIGFWVAAVVVRPVDVLRGIGPFGSVLLVLCFVFVVEHARYVPFFWRRRHAAERAAAAVRSAGHTGTLAVAGWLVSENANDAIELGRRWLRYVDQHGIALIADARTERLAYAYTVQGFRKVAVDDPLLLMRLPRSR